MFEECLKQVVEKIKGRMFLLTLLMFLLTCLFIWKNSVEFHDCSQAAVTDYFHYWLICPLFSCFIYRNAANSEKCLLEFLWAHNDVSRFLFYPPSTPKHKYIQFTVIYDKEKHWILTFEKCGIDCGISTIKMFDIWFSWHLIKQAINQLIV